MPVGARNSYLESVVRSFAFATTKPLLNIPGCAKMREGEGWTGKPLGIDLRASWAVENEDMYRHSRHWRERCHRETA